MVNTLNILGVGAGYPLNSIDNSLLESFRRENASSAILNETGIESRATVLPIDYLRETLNRDPWQSKDIAKQTISEIAWAAAEKALARAGISAEEVGLIIGENATPLETTPSEAQRLGKALSIKVPAYDVQSCSSSLLLCLNVLSKWRSERVPKYVLFISTHTPTQRVNYAEGQAGWYFGDAAAAMVVSTEVQGKLKLRNVSYRTALEIEDSVRFDLYSSAEIRSDTVKNIYAQTQLVLEDAQRQDLLRTTLQDSCTKIIGTQLSPRYMERTFASFQDRMLSNAKTKGYSLASASLSVLADEWDNIHTGESLVVMEAGLGLGQGLAWLGV